MKQVLIIDDDPDLRQTMSFFLQRLGYTPLEAGDLNQGINLFSEYNEISIVLLDLYLPEGKSTEAMQHFRQPYRQAQVIVITGQGDPESAAQCIENGAWDYVEKPITIDKLNLILQRAISFQKEQNTPVSLNRVQQEGLIGISPTFISCLEQLGLVATNNSNVLLFGETGTGKELFARAIHNLSSRAKRPFIIVDCTSLPENLTESLLHGHTKGAFTGASNPKTGLVKQAEGGTLFLDEIGELPLHQQRSFLRIVQERTVQPLGSPREEHINFRLIAASNRNLEQMVSRGEFRRDLYHRLVTSQVVLPALRNRKEDICPLVHHFMAKACQEYGIEEKKISSDFLQALYSSNWPGNIRELTNVVYASLATSQNASTIYPQHLPVGFRAQAVKHTVAQGHAHPEQDTCGQNPTWLKLSVNLHSDSDNRPPTLKEARNLFLKQLEAEYLQKIVDFTAGDIQCVCSLAGLSRPRCYELLKKHNIKRK